MIDETEALVAIDVNSGRTRSDSHDFEEIALKTNLEAVKEVVDQLRFRNIGGLKFVDITKGSGLEIFKGWGTGAAVGDYNRDGKLDVYLTSVAWEQKDRGKSKKDWESRLFEGQGGGKFVDVSAKAGVLLDRPGRCCAWSDVDGDGWSGCGSDCDDGVGNLLLVAVGVGAFWVYCEGPPLRGPRFCIEFY